jgi:phage FluMu protein Com
MQIKCAKCQKILVIPEDKLPHDRDRIVIKCPSCGQVLAFNLPYPAGTAAIPPTGNSMSGTQHSSLTGSSSSGAGHSLTGERHPVSNDSGEQKTILTQNRPAEFHPRLTALVEGTEYRLNEGDTIIGRSPGESVQGLQFIRVTGDPYISHRHCLVKTTVQHGIPMCIISDDGSISPSGEPSSNGTFHNGKRLTRFDRICLTDGDEVRIGHTAFIFKV